MERHCAQEFIAGLFIWNLKMNELLVECVVYEDDIFILLEGNNRLELEHWGTEYLRIVNAWSIGVGVAVSMEKHCQVTERRFTSWGSIKMNAT